MDRSVLEGDPHAVLEGMIIAARAIGAHQGYIYCRAEYPLAITRLDDRASQQAREYGLLGKNILGTGFDFDIEIYAGRGRVRLRRGDGADGLDRGPPRHAAAAAAVPGRTRASGGSRRSSTTSRPSPTSRRSSCNGGAWFAAIGTEKSKGTKVFALAGKIKNIGLVEVPMGTTLREIIFDIGGGIPNGRKFKAVQTGGPSGGCVPDSHLDTPVDYE